MCVETSDVTKESAFLTWKPPSEDGGTPVIGYVVERSLTTATRWIKIHQGLIPDVQFKVTELVPDNEYIFQVTAENKEGQGPPSEPTKPVIAKDPWGMSL